MQKKKPSGEEPALIIMSLIGTQEIENEDNQIYTKTKLLNHGAYMMIYIAKAFWHESQVCSFSPYKKIQTHVK